MGCLLGVFLIKPIQSFFGSKFKGTNAQFKIDLKTNKVELLTKFIKGYLDFINNMGGIKLHREFNQRTMKM